MIIYTDGATIYSWLNTKSDRLDKVKMAADLKMTYNLLFNEARRDLLILAP